MPYADVNDIHMFFEDSGTGVPVLLLHGATGSVDRPASGFSGLIGLFKSRYEQSTLNTEDMAEQIIPEITLLMS